MNPLSKTYLFISLFSFCMFSSLGLPVLFPFGDLAQNLNISDNTTVTFVFFLFLSLFFATLLTCLICACRSMIGRKKHTKPKIGDVLIALDMITTDDLNNALKQQQLRLGELLAQGGRITCDQVAHAVEIQKKKPGKIGEIFKDLNYATEEDIRWALNMKNRKLGQILRQMKLVSGYDITCALSFKKTFQINQAGVIKEQK